MPNFIPNIKYIFVEFMRFKAGKYEVQSKMLKYHRAATKIQRQVKKMTSTNLYRMTVLLEYWLRVKETIGYLMSHPKYKKRLKDSLIAKIHQDDSVNMNARVLAYLKEYRTAIAEKRTQFLHS